MDSKQPQDSHSKRSDRMDMDPRATGQSTSRPGASAPHCGQRRYRTPTKRHTDTWARRERRPRPEPTGNRTDPPRCPHRDCGHHDKPEGRWFLRKGTYWPLCRSRPLKRFHCKGCGRSFSVQTFRMDRWDKKPWLNSNVLGDLASGIGLRETARRQGLARSSLTAKSRKIARHCRRLHRNMIRQINTGLTFQMDEAVTFEQDRGTNHVGYAVMIHAPSYMILGHRAESMAPQGMQSEERKKQIQAREAKEGKRRDQTRRALIAVAFSMVESLRHRKEVPTGIQIRTDKKSTYGEILQLVMKRRLPGVHLDHRTYKGDGYKRDWMNPLFRINHSLALLRDRVSRLRRRSWLVSKRRRFLNLMATTFVCVRNYIRPWKNGEQQSPAQRAGALSRRITFKECLGWRQDWGVGKSVRVIKRTW